MNLANLHFPLPNRQGKTQKIPFSDILYLEGVVNYTLIHLQDGGVRLSPRTLLFHLNNSLDESFLRIHRSYCVNKRFIQDYDPKLNPQYLLLKGGIRLKVARRRKKALDEVTVLPKVADPNFNAKIDIQNHNS